MTDTLITGIDDISVGDFVRFVDRDKSGKFSYTGEVISIHKPKKAKQRKDNAGVPIEPADHECPSFEMLTFDGTMGFVFRPKGEELELHKSSTKPTGWAKFKKDQTGFKKAQAEVKAAEVAAAQVKPAVTKKEQVSALVAKHPRMKADALLKLALKEIGGSQGQLRAYINLALSKK